MRIYWVMYLNGSAVVGSKDCTTSLRAWKISSTKCSRYLVLENDTVGKIYTSMRILSGTVLVIMIIVLAYKFILNERVNLQAGLFRAALIVCLGVQLPGMITSSVDLAEKVYGQTKTLDGGETSTLSYSIVKENLADLQYASKKASDG